MNRFRLLSLGLAGLLAAASVDAAHAANGGWWPFGGNGSPAQAAPGAGTGDGPAPFSFSPVVKKVAPSVVTVFTTKKIREQAIQGNPLLNDPFFQRFFGNGGNGGPGGNGLPQARPRDREQKGLGSGVIISSDGLIVTNFHVIDVADEIKVAVNGDEKHEYTAKVIGKDQLTDVAVIKIDGKDLPAMPLADSSKVEVGDVVLALGNPFALGQTVTMGIVSALSRNLPLEEGGGTLNSFIQTDAAINPGNSGGPLVDTQGRMVGLNSAIYSRTGGYQGIGFAIPANTVKTVMEGLIKQGHVIRGYLGVEANPEDNTPEVLQKFGIPADTAGVLVSSVQPGSAAEAAGLRSGDFLTAFNGQPIDDFRSLRAAVTQVPPGQKAKVEFYRDGKRKAVDVVLRELKERDLAAAAPGQPQDDAAPGGGTALVPGVTVDDLDADTRRQLGAAAPPADVKGAVVIAVDPDSPAAASGPNASGLAPGDVVLEIEHKEVHSAREAAAAARGAKGSLLLRVWTHGVYRFVVVKTAAN